MLDKLPSPKSTKKSNRVGRGYGTGVGGHTTGRGTKGQKSRSGYSAPRQGFEGGQMPLSRRLPMLRGLSGKSRSRKFKTSITKHYTIQLSELVEKVDSLKISNVELLESGIIDTKSKKISLKVVFDKDIDKKIELSGIPVTQSAKAAIEKAGGKVS